MQVTVDQTSSIECNIKVVLPVDYTQENVDKRLKDLAKNVKIDGFRKGKTPLHIVELRFGDNAYFEAVNDAINDSYKQAVTEKELPVLGMPKIENIEADKGKEISYNAIVEVYPDIEVGELSKLNIEQIEASIVDTDIDNMIEQLRQQQKQYEVVEREAAIGDKVKIDFDGRIDGEPIEDGSANEQEIELGSGSMIPGFEDGIVGMKAGEPKTISVTFPEDYQAEHLRSAAAEFDIKLHSVSEAQIPDVDEAFMKKFDIDSGMDDFRAKIKSNMEKNLNQSIKLKLQQSVTKALIESHDIEVPKALLKEQVDNDKRKMFQQFERGQQFDVNQFPDEPFEDKARETVKAALIMRKIVETDDIEPDKDRIKAFIEAEADGYEQPKEVIDFYYSNENALNQVEAKILEEQVVEHIVAQMKVKVISMNYEEAMNQQSENNQLESEKSDD